MLVVATELVRKIAEPITSSPTSSYTKVTAATVTSTNLWIPLATMVAAIIAATVAAWAAFLQRRTGHEAADASGRSADASQRSAKAAEAAVALNAEISRAAGIRSDAEALAKRYQDAAAQLGHDRAAVRLAGVYAMSRLADDWPEQRQTCIDVLCAYLRLPSVKDTDRLFTGHDTQVRRTVVAVISQHVAEGSKPSWAPNDFDFTEAQLKDFRLEGCTFEGRVTFLRAVFSGECQLNDIAFQRGVIFDSCEIQGRVNLIEVRPEGNHSISFRAAKICEKSELTISTSSKEPNGHGSFDLRDAEVQGQLEIWLMRSAFRQPPLAMDRVQLNGGRIKIGIPVTLTKDKRVHHVPQVRARDWTISSGSTIDIPQELIDGNLVQWGHALGAPKIPTDVTINFQADELGSESQS